MIVIGAGLVGLAIAAGVAETGADVVVLDQAEQSHRASLGNAGLVWVQGKGADYPPYADWTRHSAALWPDFAQALQARTGVDVEYRNTGGLSLCLNEAELEARTARANALSSNPDGGRPVTMLTPAEIREIAPGIGPAVLGGSWCEADSHVNPLALTLALRQLAQGLGAEIRAGTKATAITPGKTGLTVHTPDRSYTADQVVIAAGLGAAPLAQSCGIPLTLNAVRGQIAVTERLGPLIPVPTPTIRQAANGTVMFGNSHEPDKTDPQPTIDIITAHAARAIAEFPALADAMVVRSWGAVRIVPPGGLPLYAASPTLPGVFVATCHSGVTLAAAHFAALAPALAAGALPVEAQPFALDRPYVQAPIV